MQIIVWIKFYWTLNVAYSSLQQQKSYEYRHEVKANNTGFGSIPINSSEEKWQQFLADSSWTTTFEF